MTSGRAGSKRRYGWLRTTTDGLLVLAALARFFNATLPSTRARGRETHLILGALAARSSWSAGRVSGRLNRGAWTVRKLQQIWHN